MGIKVKKVRDILYKKAPTFAKKIAPIYSVLNWKWANRKKQYIPTEEDIRRTIYNLIGSLDEHTHEAETGGLSVGYSGKEMHITFKVERLDFI